MRVLCALAVLLGGFGVMGDEIKFREIAKGSMSGFQEPVRLVITNQAQWKDVWQKHSVRRTPVPEAPDINFSENTVVFVGMGRRNTGGYAITVEEVVKQEDHVLVRVKTKSPPPGGITLQALTSPFQIVALECKPQPVRFEVDGKLENPTGLPEEK